MKPSSYISCTTFLLFILLNLTPFESTAQCPMCKTTVEANQKDGGKGLGRGLNSGILYLLSMPFIAVGFISAVYIYRKRKEGLSH
ncbi:MAG: hypothetical protein FJ344_03720 [Sphingomonadales bacterium]|nr:hypothetical protein [Sphingomonadales bacterium]